MYTERKIHGGLVGSVFLISALIVFSVHTRAAQQEVNSLKVTSQKLNQEINALTGNQSELTPRGTLSEVEQKDLAMAIPQGLEQDTIIADLNRISKTANVSFNSLSFTKQAAVDIPSVSISASFQGTDTDIVRFLKLVETNPRKLLVQDAGVVRSQGSAGLDLLNLTITLKAFYRE